MVDLIRTVVQCLECLRIEQAYQEIERVVIVRYDSIQRTLLLSQGVEVHVITICDGLDLGQIKGRQPDGGGHEDTF